jgi:hypothetical protein
MPGEGVVVETGGALIQGIFGVGGERSGQIHMMSQDVNGVLDGAQIGVEHKGKILVGGANITASALKKAAEAGVLGLVAGGIIDKDLIAYLGYDIGVAITGHESIPMAVIVTEGFGSVRMAQRTFDLLKSLEGQTASINGATQIRAGVIRPEIVVPLAQSGRNRAEQLPDAFVLDVGSSIRVIREPYFGALGAVTALPANLATVESGAVVRILEAKLNDGRTVTVPRANVEIVGA